MKMNKKLIIIPALLLAIGGGAVLAQTNYFEAAGSNPKVTASEAKAIALKEIDGEMISLEYDGDDFKPHYEIDLVKDQEKIELHIDANSGAVKVTEREVISQYVKSPNSTVSTTTTTTTTATISEQQAIDIALAKANGTVTEIALDDDDDHGDVYEIEIRNGKMDYDFKIDATTGDIVEYKEDLED